MFFWGIAATATYTALRGSEGLIFKIGTTCDAVGMLIFFRCLLRSWQDIDRTVICFSVVSVLVAVVFAVEYSTGRNLFAFLGGVPAITMVREGRLRCQGAFAHPILAGCFWASLLPILGARWWHGGHASLLVGAALLSSGFIVIASNSSTPLMGVIFVGLGAAMFPLRNRMRDVRRALVVGLIVLHFVMKGPVWSLIARINIISGSTGWHRYHLLDQAIHRFDEWWLIGTPSTSHWDEWGQLDDVTNQYVLEGVRGGILTLGLFLAMIVIAFRYVGRIWRAVQADRPKLIFAWALGVALFVHTMTFFSVSYFGQMLVLWYLEIAMIAAFADHCGVLNGLQTRPDRAVLSDKSCLIVPRRTGRAHLGASPHVQASSAAAGALHNISPT